MSSEIKPNEPTPSSAASVPSWAVHLPAPQSNPAWIEQSEVEDLIKSSATKAGVDFLIVDVRRNDLEVRTCNWKHSHWIPFCNLRISDD